MISATAQSWHFIGIGGIGMSALAHMLLQRGDSVSGSDQKDSSTLKELRQRGATIELGHGSEAFPEDSAVVYSTAISQDNPELLLAKERGQQILHRSELLHSLTQQHRVLAVAGTHGKTSTSALLAHVLSFAGLDPSFCIGGKVGNLATHGYLGKGDLFVLEADESDGSFLHCDPFAAIITNLDAEHLDYWKGLDQLEEGFARFAAKVQCRDALYYWDDDPKLPSLVGRGVSYGGGPAAQVRVSRVRQRAWSTVGDIHWNGQAYPDIELPIPGAHQFMNAVAVFALATRLGINISVIREAFASFSGVSRRSERLLEKHGVSVIDDYGHTYEEIECTLSGIRRALPDRRLLAVFQPHRYTRAQQMLADPRATPFTDADHVMVTEVFSAGEEAIEGVDEIAFCRQIYAVSGQSCESVASVDLQQRLRQWVRPLDVLVFFGAGDITRHAHAFADFLEATPQMPKLKLALLYGGPSYEHAISLRSARFVEQSLDPSFYDIQCIALSETGQWRMDNQGSLLQGPRIMERRGSKKLPSSVIEALQDCDIAFPMMHGSIGEDGTIQSLLKILGVPHVGCDPTASALCMDKDLSKRLALASKVPTAPWVAVSREEWRARGPLIYQLIAQQMDGPVFVKPAHGGSSVGVVRAANEQELYAALVACFHLDDKLIVEHEVRGRQLEFAVLGFDQVEVSWPGEILLESGTIYDYEAKYSEHSARTVERAVLDEDLVEQGQELARRVFQCLGCAGMARVDFFLDEQERFFFNEVNPIPGFTDISLYPQMWAAQGLSIHDLLNRLIGAGLRRASTGAGAAAVTVQ